MSIVKIKTRQNLIRALLACSFFILSAQKTAVPEYEVKAVFLFNFSQFVEWPAAAFASDQAPLVIGILGEDPFGTYLNNIVYGEKMKEHPLMVSHYKNLEEVKSCHILFINKIEINNMGDVLKNLKEKNVLTVSDAPNFLLQGGMVRFFIKNNKIQLQINLDAAKAAKLDISSKLLKVADIFVPR